MTLPRYTILRNDVEVLFSPTDQLPDHLQGLPYRLELSLRDAEGWKSVGVTHLPASMISFQVSAALHPDQSVPSVKTRFRAPDHSVRNDAVITEQASHSVRQKAPSSLKPTEPPGAERDPPKKEYCTYWIRHNSCDFMQEGCKYKHEMPGPKKLQELGFPEVPQWYKKKMAISNWLRPCLTEGRDNHQLSSQPSTSRSFRPITVAQINSRPQVAGTPGPTKISARIPNLIDIENPTIGTKPRYPALAVDSIKRPVRYVDVAWFKPTERLILLLLLLGTMH